MNYLVLKNIIETTITNFKCKNCNAWISESNINVLWVAWNSVNLEVICPQCKAQWVVKAEIGIISNIKNPEFINGIKNAIENNSLNKIENSELIKDNDITLLIENLKNCSSIEELLKK